MATTKKLPEPIGALILDDPAVGESGHFIPIYGMNEVQLARNGNWTSQVGFQAMSVHNWIGSNPMVFNFNFVLAAGVHVKTREDLFKKVKIAHAMISHVFKDEKVLSPPRCHLIIGDMVNAYGYVGEIYCNGQAPWSVTPAGQGNLGPGGAGRSGTGVLPTIVTFSGSFTALPGYKSGDGVVTIAQTNEEMGANHILRNGYRSSR